MKYKTATLNKKDITNFSLERNKLLNKTKYGWIFFVDSDEQISKELMDELIALNPKNNKAYMVKRKNFFLGQIVGTDKIVRLVKKGSGKWQRAVHELFEVYDGGNIGMLENYLIHNTATNLSSYISKMNDYSTLHALANKKEGKKSGVFKIILFPLAKFMQKLLTSKNVVFSIMAALHSFLSWSKLYLNQKK
ncbi:hypothetical protein ISR94_01635 [Candidatus Microgenomates bacterium]|nr:hypothetical protein [Candidatus Microgenomates bacterium]